MSRTRGNDKGAKENATSQGSDPFIEIVGDESPRNHDAPWDAPGWSGREEWVAAERARVARSSEKARKQGVQSSAKKLWDSPWLLPVALFGVGFLFPPLWILAIIAAIWVVTIDD